MKTLIAILALATAACTAAPVTYTCSGYCAPIEGGVSFDLWVVPAYTGIPPQTATIEFSAPLDGVTVYLDNLPFLIGSGVILKLDGQTVFDSPADRLVQESLYLTIGRAFTTIDLETHEWFWWRERGTLRIDGETPATVTPEPGSWVLGLAGLAVIYGRRRAG